MIEVNFRACYDQAKQETNQSLAMLSYLDQNNSNL